MPIHEFKCALNHVTEKVFLTFDAAAAISEITCDRVMGIDWGETLVCGLPAQKIDSVPGQGIFFGEGFYNGSPQARGSYTVQDSSKIANEMVQHAKEQNGGRITGPRQ